MPFSKGKATKYSMIYEALVRIKIKPLTLGLGIPNSILLLESRSELWQDQSQIHLPSPQVQELGNTPNQKKHVRKKRYSCQQTISVLKKGEGYLTSRLNCYCFTGSFWRCREWASGNQSRHLPLLHKRCGDRTAARLGEHCPLGSEFWKY